MPSFNKFRTHLLVLASILVLILSATALAVVTQSDGTVIPQDWGSADFTCDGGVHPPRNQVCLNEAEGLGPCDTPSIQYQIEADIFPQVFYPTSALQLTYTIWGEGAGYHNVFGWYRVDDPGTRHVDVGCRGYTGSGCSGAEDTNQCGGPTNRVIPSNLAAAGVDTNTAIGFFLINPVRISDSTTHNCDATHVGFCDGSGYDTNYIFYTQRELNNDGDFKHVLIWKSPNPAKPNTYYFGFEDLFRGGDNDFEDMFVEVQGIRPPCEPKPETCNNADDDCDGQTDEDLERPCGVSCDDGGVAVCEPDVNHNRILDPCEGVETCSAGVWAGCTAPSPSAERCNGKDDNCNGLVDEGNPDAGVPCVQIPGNPGDPADGGPDWICRAGETQCASGAIVCVGEIGPADEICNGKDDDCNGHVDDSVPAGGACWEPGLCGTGTLECVDGGYVCEGSGSGGPEVCNGKDDDCDKEIDEGDPGGGEPCKSEDNPGDPPTGQDWPCRTGITHCIDGEIVCTGEVKPQKEECDGIDNDCDGLTDEDFQQPMTPDSPACIDGGLALPCKPGEFSCPPDKICNKDGYCVDNPCIGVTCPTGQHCENGVCVDPCANVTCGPGWVCEEGDCVEDNCYGRGCDDPRDICLDGACVHDPCQNVSCSDGEFCRSGRCVKSCADVECPPDQGCRDGRCVADPCAGVTCGLGDTCEDGKCVTDRCLDTTCGSGRRCVDGACVDDPCSHITCPFGQHCTGDGQCGTASTVPIPAKTEDAQKILATGSGFFCAPLPVGSAAGRGAWGALVVAGLGLGWALRRRFGLAIALAALGFGASGCRVDPYCIGCNAESDAAAASRDGGGGAGSDGGGNGACTPTGDEVCDGKDNDCDGETDEGFDLSSDPANCGACGTVCKFDHAVAECKDRECRIRVCDPEYVDLDGDPANGCEYACVKTGDGTEICDGKDNDCDGETDEGFDLLGDPANCGACGVRCAFNNADAECVSKICAMGDCRPGFYDRNHDESDGCEEACTSTNGGVEICDGLDNDCDGKVDEDFNFATDPENCGGCGIVCTYAHAQPLCVSKKCKMGTCLGAYQDKDGLEATGCEYLCNVTAGGKELCDNVDNDCDGKTDEGGDKCTLLPGNPGDPPAGQSWPCRSGVSRCEGSVLKCDGEIGPETERCDGVDNDCNGLMDGKDLAAGCATAGGTETLLDDADAGWAYHSDAPDLTALPELAADAGADGGPDGGFLYVVYHDTRDQFVDGDNLRSAAQVTGVGSEDLGLTWAKHCNGESECQIDQLAGGARNDASLHPKVASANVPGGLTGLYVVWEEYNQIDLEDTASRREVYFARSFDWGQTWEIVGRSGHTYLYDPADDCTTVRDAFNLAIAADDAGRVVVVWETMCTHQDVVYHHVRSAFSEDHGATWSGITTVNSSGNEASEPRLAYDGQGRYVAVWQDSRGDGSGVYADVLDFNLGSPAWSGTDLRLDGDGGRSEKPRVAAAHGHAVAAWQDDRTQDTDTLGKIYAASIDLATFAVTAETRLDVEPAAWPDGYPSRDPAVVHVTGDTFAVAWADERYGLANILLQASLDDGATWLAEPVRAEGGLEGYHASERPVLVAGRNHVFTIWEDGRNGKLDLYFNFSIDLGAGLFTFQPEDTRLDSDTAGAHDSQKPAAAAKGGMIHVVWQDSRGTTLVPPNPNAGIYYRRIVEE